MPYSLSASIVVFDSDRALLRRTLDALAVAIGHAAAAGLLGGARITVVDNDAVAGAPVDEPFVPDLAVPTVAGAAIPIEWRRLAGQGNIGFGRGHNLVLRGSVSSDMYLVLNPDALLVNDALSVGLAWLRGNPACGIAAPNGWGADGAPIFLCKRYPDVLTLLLRAAAPAGLKKLFATRLGLYELRDVIGETAERPAQGVPLASGCCMLIRGDAVRDTGGFDPDFFVYFEDYDLSLRLAENGTRRIDYLPAMRLVHFGGNTAQKSWALIGMFIAGAMRFFNKHGWKVV